jgi:hypothetical protein
MGFYHPATLVKDAQRHGVRFAPIDVQVSAWNCGVQPDGAVRMGLRHVRGLRDEPGGASRLRAASAVFRSLDDLVTRAGLRRTNCGRLPVGARAVRRRSPDGALAGRAGRPPSRPLLRDERRLKSCPEA